MIYLANTLAVSVCMKISEINSTCNNIVRLIGIYFNFIEVMNDLMLQIL